METRIVDSKTGEVLHPRKWRVEEKILRNGHWDIEVKSDTVIRSFYLSSMSISPPWRRNILKVKVRHPDGKEELIHTVSVNSSIVLLVGDTDHVQEDIRSARQTFVTSVLLKKGAELYFTGVPEAVIGLQVHLLCFVQYD